MDESPSAALVRHYKEGKVDLETLASAATVSSWVWDAMNEIAPERVNCHRPERKRGRDPDVNLIRDVRIFGEVELRRALGFSLRKAYRDVADKLPMLTPKAVEAIYRKERKRESA